VTTNGTAASVRRTALDRDAPSAPSARLSSERDRRAEQRARRRFEPDTARPSHPPRVHDPRFVVAVPVVAARHDD